MTTSPPRGRRPGGAARAALGAAALVATAACGDGGAVADEGAIRVFAAASLTDAYEDVVAAFEAGHPGASVELVFDGSPALVAQIADGAPADVVATADERTMDRLVDEGLVDGEPRVVAENRLDLVVPAGNPGGVTGLDDLADGDLLVGLCAPEVPCGDLAQRVLAAAGVTPAPDTEEPNVRALLTKLTAGELEVGLVYRTDAAAAGGDVEVIDVAGLGDATTPYPVAVVAGSGDAAAATDFADFLAGPDGREVLAGHGFEVR
jgi:molybdate transport system substrate-binding protein